MRQVTVSSAGIRSRVLLAAAVIGVCAAAPVRQTATPSAGDLVQRILESDPWGLGNAEVGARALIHDKSGRVLELAFTARSRRYDGNLTKSLVRFTSPADLAGIAFLQIQKRSGDDDRWLYLPELSRSRRIAGRTRQNAFMGTDFSYADLDRRDLRDSVTVLKGDESLDDIPCWRIDASPRADDSSYGRLEIWVRKDNSVPVKWLMYARSGVLVKTLAAKQIRQIDGRWFIIRSAMTNHADGRETELVLDHITVTTQIPDREFTLRALEKS
jgi:outer membrane lipoprotein-sorting protein